MACCFEAGRDGFWLHRLLTAHGIAAYVLEPTSILVNRRAHRAKTDRFDADGMLRVLASLAERRSPGVQHGNDEARVGQQGWIPYQWAPVGSRPPAVRENRHDPVYLFGAICPQRGVGAAIIMPAANTEAQRGRRLDVPDDITLISLPAYSPELNSTENVWCCLRANKRGLPVWDSYEAIVAACKQAWDFLVNDPDRIKSIGTRLWACVGG